MGDKGGGVKILTKWVMSCMDGITLKALKYFNFTRIFLPEYTAYQVKKKSTILKKV